MNVHTQLAKVGHNSGESWKESAETRIKSLMAKWTANTLSIGAELAKARDRFPIDEKNPDKRPGFLRWAMQTTGLSHTHVLQLLQVHRKFGHRPEAGKLSQRVMVIFSQDTVPESARIEVIGRVAKGEKIGGKEAKKIATKHKLPGPKTANQQAAEEGRPVLSSDGRIYFGTDMAKAKEGTDRRRMIYGVRDALEHLAEIKLSGEEFLAYAFPHQLWTLEEASVIKTALQWLTDLDKAWDHRT